MTTALYTASFVRRVMPRTPHTRFHSLPKEIPALASLLETSLSLSMLQVEDRQLPKYVKPPTLFNVVSSITMLGSGGERPGAGWSITSVFRRLIVRPKPFAAVDMHVACPCRSGSLRAARAQLSANRKSLTRASKKRRHICSGQ